MIVVMRVMMLRFIKSKTACYFDLIFITYIKYRYTHFTEETEA